MQYTGIKDQNNDGKNELCQDDIVNCLSYGVGQIFKSIWGEWLVSFSNDTSKTLHDLVMSGKLGELLGNIHENPDIISVYKKNTEKDLFTED